MGQYVAYYRVSTDKQGKSGLGLDAQKAAVRDYTDRHQGELVADFVEVESGSRSDRTALTQALAQCRQLKAVLVIAKLDRLSRSVAFIANLMESGVDFVACDMPEANKTMLHVFAAMAEWESDRISERTKAALTAAKARGQRLGNPRPASSLALGRAIQKQRADEQASNILPIIREIKASGIDGLRGIATALNARGIQTPRGGRWHPQTVARIMGRTRLRTHNQ
jgi:DNA invertase Pin-like site-specific DNA recombinase